MDKLLNIKERSTLKNMLCFSISNGHIVTSEHIRTHLLKYMSNETIIHIIVTCTDGINIREDYYKLADFSNYKPSIKLSLEYVSNNFIVYSTPPENIWMIIGNIGIFTDGRLFRYKFCQMINHYQPNSYIIEDVDYTNTFDGVSKLEVLKSLGITNKYIEYTNLTRILSIYAYCISVAVDVIDLFDVIHNLYMYLLKHNRMWILNEIKHHCFYHDYTTMKADKAHLYYMKCYMHKLITNIDTI